jgi:hypothetical protein
LGDFVIGDCVESFGSMRFGIFDVESQRKRKNNFAFLRTVAALVEELAEFGP